jgi:hypothetical protein
LERPTGKPDLDNVIKSLFDGLNLVTWADDAQIVDMTASKWFGDEPRLCVRIRAAERHLTIPEWAGGKADDGGVALAEPGGCDLFG